LCKFPLGLHYISTNGLSYEYILATVDENWQETAALEAAGLQDPHALIFPASTGVFTLGRTNVDLIARGFTQDTVNILIALCEYMCISDVFMSQEEVGGGEKLSLPILLKQLDRTQWADDIEAGDISNWDGAAEIDFCVQEDHVSHALLVTAALQFPYLVPPSSSLFTASVEQKLKQLQYHIMHSSHGFYWKPIAGALMWCLVIATSFSNGLPQHPFFASYLLRASGGLCFETIEGIRIALATFYRQIRDRRDMEKWMSQKSAPGSPS
jgi:hypothetical protein